MKFYQEYKNAFRILSKGRVVLDVFSKGIKTTAMISTVTASALMGDVSTTALPTAPNIVQGNINIQSNVANMVINQSTNQGIINWGTFNIGTAASVHFNQPNASASTLNRVVGNEVSHIAGSLSATGKVILINPNGVIFGNGSRVDVGGIVASTMNLSNENYLNNTMRFSREGSTGSITNYGTIRAEDAGYVALLAPEVINEGVVIAQKGSAVFASGDAVTLSADNAGLISVTVDAATVNTLIENRGLVQADGGVVYMSAKAASDAISSTISNTGTVQANSIEERDGKIILFAHDGTMKVDGTISAKGGFVETSGEKVKIADTAKVTTLGDDPTKGEWLIDPTNFTISAGSAVQTTSGIGATTLESLIASNATTTITTSATANGSDLGDIIINTPLSWSTNTLALSAHHSILVNSPVTVSGTGGLTITTNTGGYTDTTTTSAGYLKMKQNRSGTSGTDTFDGKINWSSSDTLTINSKAYTLTGDGTGTDTTTHAGKIITTQAELEAISVGNTTLSATTRYYAIANDLTLTGTWAGLGTTTTGFRGTLEGLGHTISGITNSSSVTESYQGFIRQGAVVNIQNLGFVGATIYSGGNTAGILAGSLTDATVRNVFTDTTSRVIDTHTTGGGAFLSGIIGIYGAGVALTAVNAIVDSYNGASISMVSGTGYVSIAGGVVGDVNSGYDSRSYILKNLYNLGSITPYGATPNATWTNIDSGHSAGGIVGYIEHLTTSTSSVVANLRNYGTVNGSQHAGGVIGQIWVNTNGTAEFHAEKLSNFGNINATYNAGGVFGFAGGNFNNNYMVVKSVSNSGNVTTYSTAWASTSTGAGGIIGVERFNYRDGGKYFALDTAYNSGTITGAIIAGGIIGSAQGQFDASYPTSNYYGSTLLSNVYNTGTVYSSSPANNGLNSAGGIVGYAQNMYFVSNSSYSGNSGYGIYNAYNSGVITAAYTETGVADAVGAIIGRYMTYNDSTAPTFANVYSVTGKASNDNLIGYRSYNAGGNTIRDITSLTGVTNKSAATLQSDTLATLGFSASGKWGGGNGTTPYLLGFTTPITITLGALSKTYGDTNPTITYSDSYISSITWGSAITQYSNAGTYAYTTSNMFVPTFSVGSASDYSITYATTNSFTISPKVVTLTGIKTYDGTATTTGATFTVNGTVNSDSVNVSASTVNIASKNVGVQAISNITALTLDNANYTLTGGSGTVTVGTRAITISSSSNVIKTYDGTTSASATASVTSGALQSTDTISGGTFAFSDKNAGSGNKTVTISGVSINDGNSGNNYAVTYANNTTSTINKVTLTVTGTKVYDGTTSIGTGVLTLGGFIAGETVGYSAATASNAHVASANKYINTITLSDGTGGGLASNYQIAASYGASTNAFTITAKTLTPTISNAGVTKVYDGDTSTAMTPTYTFSGLVSGDTGATLNNTTKVYNNKDVANATSIAVSGLTISVITGSNGSAVTDYVLDSTTKTVAATITSKTVSLSSVNIADKVYDGTTAATSVVSSTFTGAVSGDDVNVNGMLESFTNKNVGTYSVSLTGLALTGAQATNYILSSTTATDNSVAITPKTVTLSASKVYDGSTNLGGAVTLGGFIGSETLTYSSAIANSAHNVAGNYLSAITLGDGTSGGVTTNYTLPTLNNANAPVTITPAILTAALSNTGVTKVYDGTTTTSITPTYTITGFITNDSAATIAHTAKAYNSKDVLTADSVVVSGLSLSGITGSNSSIVSDYVLASSSLSTSATITPKSVTVSGLVADNKVYDGTTTATLSNWGSVTTGAGSETLVLNHGSATFADKNKANTKTVTATGYNLADGSNGGVASNYVLSSTSATTTANITARSVTLSGSGTVTKNYDGLTSMPVGTDGYGNIGNGVSGDDLYVSGAPVFNSAGAGSKTVLIGSIALAGTDANNYTLNWSNGSGTINKAILTVTANNDAKFVTQSDTANFTGVGYSGFVNGEGIGALTTTGLVVARNNAGVNNAGHYSGVLAASGLSAANYDFNYVNGDYTIVPADQLLVRVANASSTYGTAAQYTITSAEYLNGSNQIVALSNPTITNNNTTFSYSDGAGGTADFTLGAPNQVLSSANLLKAGSYQVGVTNVAETSANFSNNLVVVGNLAVNQKALSVSASSVSKVYDGTTSMNNLSLGLLGVETGDAVTVGGNGSFAGKNAGINKAYSVNSLTLASADSSNYYLSGGNSMSGNDGEITKKTVTLSAVKTYDGTTDLTGKVTLNTGVTVDGLTEILSYSGATASSATVPNNISNFINAITLADGTNGGIESNYQLPTLNHTNSAVTINKKDLLVVANEVDKIVGVDDPVLSYSVNGFVNNETVSVLRGALSRVSGTVPGDYAITLGTLDADNYNILLNNAKLTIKSTFIPPIPPTISTPFVPGGGTGIGTGGGFGGGTGIDGVPLGNDPLGGNNPTSGSTGGGTAGNGGSGLGTATGTGTSGNNNTSTGTGGGGSGGSGTNGGGMSTEGENGTGGGTSWWQSFFGGGGNPTSTKDNAGNGDGSSGGIGSGDGGIGTTTGTGASSNNNTSTGMGGGSSGGSGAGDGGTSTDTGGSRETGTSTGTGRNSESTTSGNNSGSTESSSTGSNSSESSKGENDGLNNFSNKPQSTEKASFSGINVGTTQSGKEIKAIIIQGASNSLTPVTVIVSVRAGEGFSFSLPSKIINQVAQSMGSNGSESKPQITGVSLSDGRELPSWLEFDTKTMSFSSAKVPAGGLPLTVNVVVTNNGTTKNIEVVLKNDEGI